MSEYQLGRTDIPWAKYFEDAGVTMPLSEGTRAVIPHPEQDGYLYLPHEQYRTVMAGLTHAATTLQENTDWLKEKHYQDSLPPSRMAMHAIGDAVYLARPDENEMNERGEE